MIKTQKKNITPQPTKQSGTWEIKQHFYKQISFIVSKALNGQRNKLSTQKTSECFEKELLIGLKKSKHIKHKVEGHE